MKNLALIVGMAVALMIGGTAYGQSCRPAFSTPYSPTHIHTPTHFQAPVRKVAVVTEGGSGGAIVAPVAFPVLVPAFQFQYVPPCYAPPVAAVPGQSPVYQGGHSSGYAAPGGYSAPGMQPGMQPGGNLYGAPQQDRIKELAKALVEEMRRQAERELNGDGPPTLYDPSAPVAPPGNPGQTPPGQITPPGQTPPGQTPPGQTPPGGMTKEQAQPIALNALSRACASCHTGVGSKGEIVIFNQPGLYNPGAPLRSMRREIEAGRMPPPSFNYRLTPEELQALRIWLPSSRE